MAQKNLYLNILIISSGLASEAKSISFGTILHKISRTAPPAIRFSSEKKNLTNKKSIEIESFYNIVMII